MLQMIEQNSHPEQLPQTVCRKDSGTRAYMEVFTACLRQLLRTTDINCGEITNDYLIP